MTNASDSLGPLPHVDEAAVLQTKSFHVLRDRLPVERFIIRDERFEDYGVDLTLEIRAGTHATNCRAQVQLKGRSDCEPNADGSFSLSVGVTNLNYLLNGPCPLYVLYRPETGEMLFAYAADEVRRIAAAAPDWKDAKSVTLRLREHLDGDALGVLADRIVEEARRHRAIRETLGVFAPGTSRRLEVTSAERGTKVLGPQEASTILRRDGVALVAAGFSTRVLELVALIPSAEVHESGRLLLVRGYAELNNHRYLAASGSLREAKVHADELDPVDASFLDLLLISAEHAFGELPADDFQRRCAAWRTGAPEYLGVQYDLARLWSRRVQVGATQAEQFQAELSEVLERMIALPNAPPALRQQAQLLSLFIAAQDHTVALGSISAHAREPAIWMCAYSRSPQEELAAAVSRLNAWRNDLEELLAEIRETANAPLYCQALLARDICEGFVLSQLQISALFAGAPEPGVPTSMFEKVRETQALARQCDQPDTELRSRLVESDLTALAGDAERARLIASEVLNVARTLRFADIERVAAKAVSSTMHDDLRRDVELVRDGGAVFMAGMSDADLDAMALQGCETLGAPKEMLPVFRDGVECQRAIGCVQRDWCRHFEVEERWSSNPAAGPERRVTCVLLARHSAIPARDWRALIPAFRGANCTTCASREPWSAQ